MKALKRVFWLIIAVLTVIILGIITLPLLIIWGGEKLDEKIATPLINFVYKKLN